MTAQSEHAPKIHIRMAYVALPCHRNMFYMILDVYHMLHVCIVICQSLSHNCSRRHFDIFVYVFFSLTFIRRIHLSYPKKLFSLTVAVSVLIENHPRTVTFTSWWNNLILYPDEPIQWIGLDISCESSAVQTIHLKCQVWFYRKNNIKKIDRHLL